MARSKLDKVVESYVSQILSDEEKCNPDTVAFLAPAIKGEILADVRDKEIQRMKQEIEAQENDYRNNAMVEAKKYKKTLIKKAQRSLIYETIIVAFLIGLIVNQVTNLLPSNKLAAVGISIAALLVCVLIILAETRKD